MFSPREAGVVRHRAAVPKAPGGERTRWWVRGARCPARCSKSSVSCWRHCRPRATRLIVLEAMKMEHHMNAPSDGVVAELRVEAGGSVATGDLLLIFEAESTDADQTDETTEAAK